jgi:phospholipid transport system substrate-binding protein
MTMHPGNFTSTSRLINPRRHIAKILATALGIVMTALMLVQSPAWADDPGTVVQNTVNQALKVLRDKDTPLAQRQEQLRQIVANAFEFTEMGKSALGSHWRQLSPEQQKEFTDVFVSFIEDSYLSKISDYKGPDYQVQFLASRMEGSDYAQVNTDIVRSGKEPIHVNYRLQKKGSDWKVYDVTVDAISIIANYRNQFNRVMNNQGYATLISDLKSKQAALAASLANH